MIRSITLYFVLFFALSQVALAASLYDATVNNDYNLADSLIANGADVNATNNDGWTPLHITRASKNWNMAKLLE